MNPHTDIRKQKFKTCQEKHRRSERRYIQVTNEEHWICLGPYENHPIHARKFNQQTIFTRSIQKETIP